MERGRRHSGSAKGRIREVGRILENRGAEAPPPGNLEASATCCNYTNYTLRGTTCGEGHVVVCDELVTGQRVNAMHRR